MSSTPTAPKFTGKAVNWSIFLSLCLIMAGFFTLLVPFVGGIGVAIFIGWAMVISGITHFIFAFKTPTAGSLIWELLVGAVYLINGVYILVHPLAGLASLTLLLAIYLFIEALFEIIHFFQVKQRSGAVWLLVNGLVTLVLAVMIWKSGRRVPFGRLERWSASVCYSADSRA
jgi:uncharacterized membrane protein HdeD (DUF308 family)